MKKYLLIAFCLIVLSFYFFPFQLRILPTVNTKMILAAIGLVLIPVQLVRSRSGVIGKDTFVLLLLAGAVSLSGLLSTTYNDTSDYTYTTYLVSMCVWFSAAYVVISMIRQVHGGVSVFLLCNYLIALCVLQCVLAISMNFYEPLKDFIYSFIDEGTATFLEQKNRLSGLGVGLDVAGSRFSAVLIMLSVVCVKQKERIGNYFYLYVLAFFIISIIGNMIARTTTVGMLIAIAYFIFSNSNLKRFNARLLLSIAGVAIVLIPLVVYFYNKVPEFHKLTQFAFEGFFSLAESGSWEVSSNDILKSMYVFPDNLKTWLIGDGYFDATTSDPYYVGKEWTGYYMATDVGYLRFIFYFGIIGLGAFIFFIYKCGDFCMKRFPEYRIMFIMLLCLNYIVWFKVSTDIFLVFALFLCISGDDEEDSEEVPQIDMA